MKWIILGGRMRRCCSYLWIFLFCWTPGVGAVDLAGVQIHGFVSQGFFWSNDNNYNSINSTDGSFQFNEMGLTFSKNLTDNLRMGMQFLSRDYGRTGNNQIELDWAYADYRWRDWLGIYAGLMKMPHGLYNESRDQDMVRTAILLPQSVYPELLRDYYTRRWGIGLYGHIPSNKAGNFSYQVMVGSYNPDPENSGLSILVEGNGGVNVVDIDHGIQYAGSLIWETPLSGLRIGATGWFWTDGSSDWYFTQSQTTSTLEVKRWSTVYSIEYIRQNLKLAAEYRWEHTESSFPGLGLPTWTRDTEGYYLSTSYRFTDWFELGAYYSILYPDVDDRDGNNYKLYGMEDFLAWQKDLSLTARFDINDNWLVKIEGHYMDGAADTLSVDNPDGIEQYDFLFAAKLSFNF